MKEMKIIREEVEDILICRVLNFAKEEGMTITNIKEAMGKVYSHMERNAMLEKDYLIK